MATMTQREACDLLDAMGYDPSWTEQQIMAAVPVSMRNRVAAALRLLGSSEMAEADALEREGQ